MSPLLFNLYTAEIEKKLRNRDMGGVGIGKMRIWCLAYVDDILVANNREAQNMIMSFRKLLKNKKLELSINKIKSIGKRKIGKKNENGEES